MSTSATSRDEIPVLMRSGTDELCGIVTRPVGPPSGIGVVLLSGGGWAPMMGRNRVWVRLARSLASAGHHVIRFDYRGVGESTGVARRWHLGEPAGDDATAAVRALTDHGATEIVLVGNCFGARSALACADEVPNLRGALLFAAPVLDFELGEHREEPLATLVQRASPRRAVHVLRDRTRRRRLARLVVTKAKRTVAARGEPRGSLRQELLGVSSQFLRPLRHLVDRRVPVRLVFGDKYYDDFSRAQRGPLGRVLDRAGDLVTVVRKPGKDLNGMGTIAGQDALMACVVQWLADLERGAVPEATAS